MLHVVFPAVTRDDLVHLVTCKSNRVHMYIALYSAILPSSKLVSVFTQKEMEVIVYLVKSFTIGNHHHYIIR